MKLLVNADDFGRSEQANLAIIHCLQNGICDQTSIMVNSNYFDQAVQLAKENNLMDKVGLHINLCEGTPLSSRIKRTKGYAFQDQFHFQPSFIQRFTKKDIDLLTDELEAQINKYIDAGFQLGHIDSHHCTFYERSVLLALLPLLKKYHFKSIRPIGNSFFTGHFSRQKYGQWWKKQVRLYNLKMFDYTSSIATYQKNKNIIQDLEGIAEIYCHPILIDHTLYDNFTGGTQLLPSLESIYQ